MNDKSISAATRAARLIYVSDEEPGIRRINTGSGFRYVRDDGRKISRQDKDRIAALVIPPAWTDVWICAKERGHLQATGRDARGRKQSRYHARWREVRDASKFDRLAAFGRVLPKIRSRTRADLARKGLPRRKVLAAIVRLLEMTHIRVGNEEYARQNGSVGLTTMRDGNVEISGKQLRFEFKGKSGKQHEVGLRDRRLARIVKKCQDIPGQKLFQYFDPKGNRRGVTSSDVNGYLREITGRDFTAKDFRTWNGTVLACQLLNELEPSTSKTGATRGLNQIVAQVAAELGNTKAVCRKFYIHPAVIDAYTRRCLGETNDDRSTGKGDNCRSRLRASERALMALLRRRK